MGSMAKRNGKCSKMLVYNPGCLQQHGSLGRDRKDRATLWRRKQCVLFDKDPQAPSVGLMISGTN